MPKVSVIIPLYNGKQFIDETLASVVAQNWKDYEIIVVDDGSTDQPEEVLAPWIKRIRYIRQTNSGGPAGAKNRGIKESRGKYLAFLDQDDLWQKDKLAKQVAILDKDARATMVASNVTIVDAGGQKPLAQVWPKPEIWRRVSLRQRLIAGNIILTSSSVMARADFFARHKGFDTRLKLADDYEMWWRMAVLGKVILMREPLTYWRYHQINWSRGSEKMRQDMVMVYKIMGECKAAATEEKKAIKTMEAIMKVRLANYYLVQKRDTEAKALYREVAADGERAQLVKRLLAIWQVSPILARSLVAGKIAWSGWASRWPGKREVIFPGGGVL